MTQKRETNFELLRILAMFMIVVHHFVAHSNISISNVATCSNKFFLLLCNQGGMLGNDIFVMLAGYFLSQKIKINYMRAARLWFQMFFYSIGIYLIFVFLKVTPFATSDFVRFCLPVTYKQWWFASVYIYLFLLSPLINIIIFNIDTKQYLRLLVVSFIILCFIPTITGIQGECNNIVWFVFLYFVGGFIAKEKDNIKGKWIYLAGAILGSTLINICYILMEKYSRLIPALSEHRNSLFEHQYLPSFAISLFIVIFVSKCNSRYNSVINVISSASFGVYLIHEHEYIRELLWDVIFRLNNHINDNIFSIVVYILGVCILVYITCSIIELIRKNTLEKQYLKFLDRIVNYSKSKV